MSQQGPDLDKEQRHNRGGSPDVFGGDLSNVHGNGAGEDAWSDKERTERSLVDCMWFGQKQELIVRICDVPTSGDTGRRSQGVDLPYNIHLWTARCPLALAATRFLRWNKLFRSLLVLCLTCLGDKPVWGTNCLCVFPLCERLTAGALCTGHSSGVSGIFRQHRILLAMLLFFEPL